MAVLVVLSFPELKLLHLDTQEVDLSVPYISGFLGFREVPVYADMLQRANQKGLSPQVVLVDGNGVLHHRGLGSASHLGVVLDCPSIGVSKTLLHVDGLQEATVRRRFLDHDRVRSRVSFGASSAVIGPADAATWAALPAAETSTTADAMTQPPPQSHVLQSGWTPAIGLAACSADGSTGAKSGSYLAALLKPPSPPVGLVATAIDSGGGCRASRAPTPLSGGAQGSQPLAAGWAGGDIRELEGGACAMDLVGASGTAYGRALSGHAKSKRPVYVSVGHRVSLETAVRVVLACSKFRIPEPIRMADLLGRDMVRQKQATERKDGGERLLE